MKYNELGTSGISVSEICLGTMTWGSQNTEAEGHAQMDYAIDHGVNFFDTAEMYPTTPIKPETQGDTEAIIGTWFAKSGKRDDIVLATKVCGQGGFGSPLGDPITPEKIRNSLEQSLKRLKTDHVDLYQLHWPNRGSYHFRQTWNYAPEKQDTEAALDNKRAILETLGAVVAEGKVRAIGLSNDTAWGTMTYLRMARELNLPRVVSIQNEYSLMHRIFDTDMAEVCHHEKVGLLAFTPLAAGLLTGKYADGSIPEGSRRSISPNLSGRVSGHEAEALAGYLGVAAKHGLDPTEMSIAFCLTRAFMASVIIGATSMPQLERCIAAKDLVLSDAVMDDIAAVYRRHPIPM